MSTTKQTKQKKTTNQKEKIQSTIEKLEHEKQTLQQELNEKNDRLLRTCADLQNYQRRAVKELLFKEEETKKKYLSELIDIYELLTKAYEDDNPKKGLELILQNMNNFFKKEEITPIECTGKPFDHTLHHAISTVTKKDCDDNMITEEIKKGYLIKDKVFRPSQVIVVKNEEKK